MADDAQITEDDIQTLYTAMAVAKAALEQALSSVPDPHAIIDLRSQVECRFHALDTGVFAAITVCDTALKMYEEWSDPDSEKNRIRLQNEREQTAEAVRG